MAGWTSRHTRSEIEAGLAAAGVPGSRVATIGEVVASPQLRAREMFVEVAHATLRGVVLTGSPVKLDGTPATIRKSPPVAGEDTERVYRDVLGLDAARIQALRDAGAI